MCWQQNVVTWKLNRSTWWVVVWTFSNCHPVLSQTSVVDRRNTHFTLHNVLESAFHLLSCAKCQRFMYHSLFKHAYLSIKQHSWWIKLSLYNFPHIYFFWYLLFVDIESNSIMLGGPVRGIVSKIVHINLGYCFIWNKCMAQLFEIKDDNINIVIFPGS